MRRTWTLVVLAVVGCEEDVTQLPKTPAWVGTYALVADSSADCAEVYDPSGRRCVCGTSGYYEGTLSLTVDDTGGVAGTLLVKECRPDSNPACGTSVSFAVGPFYGPYPPPGAELPPAWLRFCANGCPYGANDGWRFWVTSEASSLVGTYYRADGNVRGCGSDSGPFTAVKQ